MSDLIFNNISLVFLIPLWIFLIIMCGRFFAVYVNKILIYGLTLFSSLLGLFSCVLALYKYESPLNWVYPFIKINSFVISFGLRIDKLSLILGVVLFLISFLVQWYSISYMKDDKKNYRFFAFLNLFNFSMAFLLFSPNLFQMYVFWELVGIVSYLLIGYDYKNTVKSLSSKRVFLINRVGDTALITAIILTSYYMSVYSGNSTLTQLSFEDFNVISVLLSVYASPLVFYIICGLFILAAMVKSAQFPFYIWLQDAMEARLPVSALLHSSTMVAAGVFLIIKMIPIFSFSSVIMTVISVIGILTAIICSIIASLENHPKKLLAYSTSANFGLMFFSIGLMNNRAALVFLATHAFLKSTLFLLLPKEEDKNLYFPNSVLSIIAALSLSGIILSGLAGKELIYHPVEYNFMLKVLFLIVAFLSALYLARFVIISFKQCNLVNKINFAEFLPNLLLLICNIFFYISFRGLYKISEPFVAAIGGILFCVFLYKKNWLYIISIPKFNEKFFYDLLPLVYDKFCILCSYIETVIFSNYKLLTFFPKFLIRTVNIIEEYVMLGSVRFVERSLSGLSKTYLVLQTGNIQRYNFYALIFITITVVLVIIGYMFILNMF